jgi:hypothetical protein
VVVVVLGTQMKLQVGLHTFTHFVDAQEVWVLQLEPSGSFGWQVRLLLAQYWPVGHWLWL